MIADKVRLGFLIMLPLLFSEISFAKEPTRIESELGMQSTFSLGNNGFIGSISEAEKLYLAILQLDNAHEAFMRLATSSTSTPESKLYAICGLKKLGQALPTTPEFSGNSSREVTVLKGDILRTVRFNEIYDSIKVHGC
ncbi:MchS3 family protein [Serratia sp. 2723]|uniref:MchS3 family protein n=1 Tax=unclassified Serratia (in: enterobacteria) TaxID=2647522 RepID=UPI003D2079D6